MSRQTATFLALILSTLRASAADGDNRTRVVVRAAEPIATVPAGLYGAGYDGWGDITSPQGVEHLQAVGVKYCRIELNLREFCGDRFGDFRWEYTTPKDCGVGFVSRVKKILQNGWVPILAVSTSHALPSWFHGDANDAKDNPWFKLNLDGSLATDQKGNQYDELSRVTRGIAAGLSERGLTGLHWETIYEIGHTMPMAEIHYYAARGIREADPTARLMGPATWPGWTVEERFVKPFLARYGADLLDFVTVHWYADNEHGLWAAPGFKERKGPITMADHLFLCYLMETTPKYSDWCRSLRSFLDDPKLNPGAKRIGIAYTEFDATAESPFGRNPENADWPNYRADADCYLNTNYFGGVWCSSVLCHLASSGCLDIACKFNTRQYYGLIDNAPEGGFFRQPVWFAWKLLQDTAGMKPGAQMLATNVEGPVDDAAKHAGGRSTPWVETFAVWVKDSVRLILINRSFEDQPVSAEITGLPDRDMSWSLRRFEFREDRVARFIGRKSGTKGEGAFEGTPKDDLSLRCLRPVAESTARKAKGVLRLPLLKCPPISMIILVLNPD